MKSSSSLQLFFGKDPSPGLYRTMFRHPSMEVPVVGIRGTTIPASGFPFIWGSSAHALSLLLVTAVYNYRSNAKENFPPLEGPSASPAGSLARLLKKRSSSWLLDIFGADVSGRSFLHKIVILGNPRGRQQGPISASLKADFLPPENISIFIDGDDKTLDLRELLSLRDGLSESYVPRRDPLASRRENLQCTARDLVGESEEYVLAGGAQI